MEDTELLTQPGEAMPSQESSAVRAAEGGAAAESIPGTQMAQLKFSSCSNTGVETAFGGATDYGW